MAVSQLALVGELVVFVPNRERNVVKQVFQRFIQQPLRLSGADLFDDSLEVPFELSRALNRPHGGQPSERRRS